MSDQPDELTTQGEGVKGHFLGGATLILGSGGTAFGGFIKTLWSGLPTLSMWANKTVRKLCNKAIK